MGLWYPMATRAAAPNDGGSMLGGPPRVCWHTTEGSTAAGAIAAMRAADSWAHFTATYEHGHLEVYQHIPLDRAARALRHPAGTVDTNRMGDHCVQVEVVGFAARAPGLSAGYLAALSSFARDIEAVTGTPRRCGVTFKAYPDSYGAGNGVRLSEATWRSYSGHLGHMHVPGNEHGDPGALDIAAILRLAAPPIKENPMAGFTAQDLEDAAYVGAKRALNEGTGRGQASWPKTEQAILATVQSLINEGRSQQGALANSIDDLRSALLGAIAALDAPPSTAHTMATAAKVVDLASGLGVQMPRDAVEMALHATPAAA